MIACGLGILWSGRAHVEVRSEIHREMHRQWRHKRLARFLLPAEVGPQLVFAYVFGVAAIAAGVIVLI